MSTGEVVAERVQDVRDYYGWSQEQLAAATGLSQPAISQLERGSGATEQTISKLAKGTGFSVEWFYRGPLPELAVGSLKYRKTSKATVHDDKRIRTHVRHTIEILDGLTDVAKPPPVRLDPVESKTEVDGDFIESLATEAREWMGIGPLDPVPNMIRAVERAGVIVIRSGDEPGGHTGVSFWPSCPTGRPIIWVTRNIPGDRGRMTLGHEVGHLVLHSLRRLDSKKAETEAYRFGGAFLVPREAIEQIPVPVTLLRLAEMKAKWGIAIQALVMRCREIGVIDISRCDALFRQISSRGWRVNEPVDVPIEHPVLMAKLMTAAVGTADPFRASRQVGLAPTAMRDLVS